MSSKSSLLEHARTPGAERRTNGYWLPPGERAAEQQIPDVRTRDQEHERHCSEENQKARSNVAHDLALKRPNGSIHPVFTWGNRLPGPRKVYPQSVEC
jgi:hypothetical protein